MPRISLATDILPMSDFRTNFATYMNQLHENKRPLILTQHGRSTAVLLDVAEYERLIDKFELYEDIEIAKNQLNSGLGVSHSTVKSALLKRHKQ